MEEIIDALFYEVAMWVYEAATWNLGESEDHHWAIRVAVVKVISYLGMLEGADSDSEAEKANKAAISKAVMQHVQYLLKVIARGFGCKRDTMFFRCLGIVSRMDNSVKPPATGDVNAQLFLSDIQKRIPDFLRDYPNQAKVGIRVFERLVGPQ